MTVFLNSIYAGRLTQEIMPISSKSAFATGPQGSVNVHLQIIVRSYICYYLYPIHPTILLSTPTLGSPAG